MSPEAKEKMWKVKAEDGSVFGPASMATLLAWARDGRLAASHVISSDGKTWTPVASHSELAMDWIAEISPGKFYGPIHRDALDELLRNGTLAANSASDAAIVGDFASAFRWGYAKEIPLEVIEFGNPDNDPDLGDLKGHNQVYLRCEAYLGWAILDPSCFVRVVQGA